MVGGARRGHQPIRETPLTGRPLFTRSLDEQKAYRREHYLLAASYGAVFGILSNEGKSFYIADGVNRRDYGFEDGVLSPPTAEQREKNRHLIDEDLNRLARFFPSKGSVRLGP